MALICKNGNIPCIEWVKCLMNLDRDIMDLHDALNYTIIISSPYKPNDMKQALQQHICDTFIQQSILFCCDIIMDFIIPNNQMTQIQTSSVDLLEHNAIIIINRKNSKFISIPRNVAAFSNKWKISWWKEMENDNKSYNKICSSIANKIGKQYLSQYFYVEQDWSQRTDFTDVSEVGYLCDNGVTVEGDVLRQRHSDLAIFVNFHTDTDASHYGRKHDWISVPNQRLCPPPKERPPPPTVPLYLRARGIYSNTAI